MKRALLPIAAIVGLNLLAHFLPFERVSLASDDLQILQISPGQARAEYVRAQLTTARRPLEISYILLHWFAGENKLLWVTLLFLASSLLAVSVYFLMTELVGDRLLSLICSAFFILLPNKEQLYHHLADAHLNAVYAITVAGLALFLAYLRKSNPLSLLASLICYTISIFWYELGFFLPFVLVAAAALYGRKKLGASLLFFLPALFYLLLRSGLDPVPLNYLWSNLSVTVPNLYFGRQMIKWTLYGLARFPFIEPPWIFVLLVGNGLALGGFLLRLRKSPIPQIPLRAILLSMAMSILFLIPAALVPYGPLSRHTALASLGFSIFVIAVLRFLFGARPILMTFLMGVGLVVNQGIAWNQVVSCRMNNAVLETLQEKKGSILQGDRILIDQYSFAQRIPYTWIKDPLNQLDLYWGVDGLVGSAFQRLVPGIVGKSIPVYILRSPLQTEGEMLTFQVYNTTYYRFEPEKVSRKGSTLIDYATVYSHGFHHGKRFAASTLRTQL